METTPFVYVVSFILVLAILITVHEFGHFWVARRLGVKVLRFSIGFGKALWSRQSRNGETEYMVAAIPLGGYVKMLDEREGEVAEHERGRAFNNKPVLSRMAIVLAGPLFNFLFAILVFWLMFMSGVPGLRAMLGEVQPGSPAAQAGFREGDQVVRVDGREVDSWDSFRMQLYQASLNNSSAGIAVVDQEGNQTLRTLYWPAGDGTIEANELLQQSGFRLWTAPARLGEISPDGAAHAAGLRSGDLVLRVDGEPTRHWSEWVDLVREHPGQKMLLEVEREGRVLELELTPAVRMDDRAGGEIGFVGVHLPQAFIDNMRITVQYGPFESLAKGVGKTWDMSRLMLDVLWRMLIGEASLKNVSGPITIAQFAGDSASHGLTQFLSFLAVVSISLGVLNLLPVPILDGGHFMYYLIELLRGRPLSQQAQETGQRIGILLILALMTLAFYNDFMRLFG